MSQCVNLWRMENMYICCLSHLQTSLLVPMLWPRRHRNKWSSRPLDHCKDNEDWAEDDVLSGEARSIDKFKFQTMILCEKFAMKMPAVGEKVTWLMSTSSQPFMLEMWLLSFETAPTLWVTWLNFQAKEKKKILKPFQLRLKCIGPDSRSVLCFWRTSIVALNTSGQ